MEVFQENSGEYKTEDGKTVWVPNKMIAVSKVLLLSGSGRINEGSVNQLENISVKYKLDDPEDPTIIDLKQVPYKVPKSFAMPISEVMRIY